MSAKQIEKAASVEHTGKTSNNAQEKGDRRIRIVKVRLIPIWLRAALIMIAACICLFAGALFGYSVMGDGKPQDAWKKETWTHIIDIVQKEK